MRWRRRKKSVEWYNPFADFSFVSIDPIESLFIHLPPDVVMLPLSFLKGLVKPSTFNTISRLEEEYVRSLCEQITAYGIQKPLIIAFDGEKVCLLDGHHRVHCAEILGIWWVPVVFETAPKITKHSVPLTELVRTLWSCSSDGRAPC